MLTTASSTVPALSSASTTIRLCVADTVPRVEPDDTVTDIADVTALDTTVPLVKVADRNSRVVGFSVTVSALAATVAVIGWMTDSGNPVNDPPPEKVKVPVVVTPVVVLVVALTVVMLPVVALTVVMLPVVALTVVIVPVVAANVVNAPVLGATSPMGVGELSSVANPPESRGELILSTVYSNTLADVYTLNLYEDEPSQISA